MSNPASSPETTGTASNEDLQSALFLDLVAQHAEMAMMFLGKVPHPQTGEKVRELDTARLFISQLEMIEAKTKGNLNQREQALLKQALMATRMAFVEAVEAGPTKSDDGKDSVPGTAAAADASAPAPASTEPSAQAQENASSTTDDERKKFVKKY